MASVRRRTCRTATSGPRSTPTSTVSRPSSGSRISGISGSFGYNRAETEADYTEAPT